MITILLFCVGLLFLIKGGDIFVDSSVIIAKRFHIPELLIGATIVSIGTTLPEVMVSATGALQGNGAIAYGNAIGSIICNTSLILAITITFAPSIIDKKDLYLPSVFFLIASIFYAIISYATGYFSRIVGIILLSMFVVYITIQARSAIKASSNTSIDKTKEDSTPLRRPIILLIIGAATIAVGAKLLVDNGIKLAEMIGVPESVIALTMVALGTSLPELITAIQSLIKGHGLLSLGNIIGANLFNLILVNGVAITLNPFIIPNSKLIFGYNSSLILDIPLMFIVMGIVLIPSLLKGRLYRIQGILLLAIYVLFIGIQFFL